MPQIDLSLSAAAGIALLFLAASAALSFLYYRTTLPPVSRARRLVLGTLRGAGLFLTAALLLEPLIRLVDTVTLPPTLAVLIDDTRSMGLEGRKEAVIDELRVLSSATLPEGGVPRYYLFGSSLSPGQEDRPDSLLFDRDETNIAASLAALEGEKNTHNIRAVVLLTDGSSNAGANPVYDAARLGLPVYTIGFGDSTHPKDVAVTRVNANRTVYENIATPVDVTIRSSGYGGQTVQVTLLEEGSVVSSGSLQLGDGVRDYTLRLEYTPKGDGVRRLSVSASVLDGELTGKNNRSDFFVRILKGRLAVLVIAGAPSPDVSATLHALRSGGEFAVTSRVHRSRDGFYEGPLSASLIDSSDCLVLVSFPAGQEQPEQVAAIVSAVAGGKPALFMAGPVVSQQSLRPLAPSLGLSILSGSSSEELAFLQPQRTRRNDPLLNPGEGGFDTWDRLPPLFRSNARVRPLPGATVLAVPRVQGVVLDDPLLVTYSIPPVRTVSLLAYGVWRWPLMSAGDADTADRLTEFLHTAVRWLTTGNDQRGLAVQTSREFYPEGDPVEFAAQAYDATAQPVDDASVHVVVTARDRTVELPLSPIGNGRYEGPLYGLGPGEYRYRAAGISGGDTLGRASGRFVVGETNLEFRDIRMDASLLRRLAQMTGGSFSLPGSDDVPGADLRSLGTFRSTRIEIADRIELWHWPVMLVLIILLFAAEWLIRKQSGMA